MAPLLKAFQSTRQDKKMAMLRSARKNETQEQPQISHEPTYSQNY